MIPLPLILAAFIHGPFAIDLVKALKDKSAVPHACEVAVQGEALAVTFKNEQWPNLSFAVADGDWSQAFGLEVELENPGPEATAFFIRVDDDPSADGVKHCITGSASIEPKKRKRFLLPVGRQPMAVGMRALPPVGDGEWMAMWPTPFNAQTVCKWQIFLSSPQKPSRLILHSARLIRNPGLLKAIVDRYGQYAKGDWPGKVRTDADLKKAAGLEDQDLKARPSLPDRNAYGGWAKGPKLEATGRFRTAQVNGKWWLVDPEGRLFFSMGIDCVWTGEGTMVTGREELFAELPKEGDPLHQFFSKVEGVHSGPVKDGVAYDFRGANSLRKYGPDWQKIAFDLAARRLKSWGFNTVGNWSDGRLFDKKVPYVATTSIWGSFKTIRTGNDYWGPMPDVFDPAYKEAVRQRINEMDKRVIGDPWCVGWFVDNELSWSGSGEEGGRYGIAYGALRAPADAPAKRALIDLLKRKYREVEALNKAWGTRFSDWTALNKPLEFDSADAAKRKDDLLAFVNLYCDTYFKTISEELRRADPKALYLGTRFAWFARDPVTVCAKYADVVSFNIYKTHIDTQEYAWLNELGKPCIIGEFHFGATDRGMFHPGLVRVPDQKARAAQYEKYVNSVLDHPALVGCHWFQYADEPVTGRWFDGENYNIGILNVTDAPYPEMVEAARRVHGAAYRRRFGKH